MKKMCEHCGKAINRPPSGFKGRKAIYCCLECKNAGQRWQVACNCSYCGKALTRPQLEVKSQKAIFCDRECWRKQNQRRIATCQCEFCGRPFTRGPAMMNQCEHHYCSRKCAHAARVRYVHRSCEICGAEFIFHPSDEKYGHTGQFCSVACKQKADKQRGAETFLQRFWSRVDKNGPIPPHKPELGQCWLWTGGGRNGYGQISLLRQSILSHRISYELKYGPIPHGMLACHKCDTPPCVNPDHLFLGTNAENAKDKTQKGRGAKGSTHGNAKLTNGDVDEIRRQYVFGVTRQKDIAVKYGVSRKTIYNVVHNKVWSC